MKKIHLLMVALALLVGAAQAQAEGRPDPEFGTKGRVLIPSGGEEEIASALLGHGRVIVAKRKRLLALLPTGRVDPSFGAGGSPDGQLDLSFSGDGFTLADFGFPPAQPGNVTNVSTNSIALDGSDRILLSGQRSTGTRLYKGFYIGIYEPYVARLNAAGEEDRSFAGDAAVQLAGYERVGRPTPDVDGGVYFTAVRSSGQTLVHLLASGELDPGFGEGGGRPLPRGTKDFVLDATGGLLPYGKVQGSAGRLANGVLIKRLRADGSLDRGFGRKGAAAVRVPRTEYGLVAADIRGGILVGLNLRPGRKHGKRPAAPGSIGLARLRSDGSLDRSFGRGGLVEIPFGGGTEAGLQALTATATEALLTGSWCAEGSCGDALAKAKLRSR